ncbi:chemotaxis protein [Burkholderia sp. Leaf177]|uniref:methyl-accepting chemotaxis protein n=1 Tax=Burkholderia sp. Leaf177 TaxID=1736287 RepID=UPI0007017A2D|nr:methyl-accepting chemotaxis protein [Burkholderia sp. Leaf177]KQR77102.1 chemotaxis protein [Burkholderia sp. Leaf177]
MFSSIRVRILMICVATLVAALSISGVLNYYVARSYDQETINQNLAAISAGHSLAISDWLTEKATIVNAITPLQLDGDAENLLTQVKASGSFAAVYMAFPDKRFTSTSSLGHRPSSADVDPTTRPYYRQALATGKLSVTDPYIAHTSRKLVVTLSRPILENGAIKAVLGADIALDSVSANVNAIHPTPASFAFLVNQNGTIIAHPDVKLSMRPVTDITRSLTAETIKRLGAASEPLNVKIGDRNKLLHAEAIPGTDWELVIALDESDATAGMHALARTEFFGTMIVALAAILLIGMLTAPPFKRLSHARDAMEEIGSGSGDLTKRLSAEGDDEVAAIARSFNLFVDKMTSVLVEIRISSEAVKNAASEISQGNQDLSARTEHAASSLQETAASMEEIHGTVGQSAEAATQAHRLAEAASQVALQGGVAVTEVVSTMAAISASSGKIAAIIGVIDGIAFQTNILALNAAVEAARAGEQGRGFAVVAGEVRILAQRSAQAAKEIKQLIDDSANKVTRGAQLVTNAGETMDEIVKSVRQVSTIIAEISVATSEQRTGVGQVNQAVTQLDAVTQQNAALVEQSSAAADFLKEQSFKLAEIVGRFRLADIASAR